MWLIDRAFCILHSGILAFCILHSAFCILHFAFCHSAFCILHFAFYSESMPVTRRVLLRDRLRARLAEMGAQPDHQRLAADVLGIRNASGELARRLIAQALVIEERHDAWRRLGDRVCAGAPKSPGVYVLRDEQGRALYVGKAAQLQRRLRAHFARRRWPAVKAAMARAVDAEWQLVGSELEALLREATLIEQLQPIVNVQTGPPALRTRAIPRALIHDVIVVVPSGAEDAVELVAVRADGPWMIQRTRRDGTDLVVHTSRLMRFFHSPVALSRTTPGQGSGPDHGMLAPIVFSWLARRGVEATRLDPHDAPTRRELAVRLSALLRDDRLFTERLDQR
jgi:predicted GIY-YIG superfamily endonuclease